MEKKEQVNTYQIKYICDKCHEGEMIYSRITYFTMKYEHLCNKCGNKQNFDVIYPRIRYEPFEIITDMIGPVVNKVFYNESLY